MSGAAASIRTASEPAPQAGEPLEAGRRYGPPARPHRALLERVNLVLFLAGIVAIAVVANFFASRPALRLRLDATRTRAYSLSEQTRLLLAELQGQWTIAVVMSPRTVGADQWRQVREVLGRFEEASEAVTTIQIDPADPDAIDRYDRLLSQLRSIEREPVAEYERALAAGQDAARRLGVFASRLAGGVASLRGAMSGPPEEPARVDEAFAGVAIRPEQADRVVQEQQKALAVDEGRPIPDYEAARSILAAALWSWAQELHRIAQTLGEWRRDPKAGAALRQFASDWQEDCQHQAVDLAAAADPLRRLGPLALARIGRSLDEGEAAIVIGPRSAAVLGSSQLLPALNLRSRDGGEITYDQRFRGEQALSAAIRSLLVPRMPMVVFVHAQGESMLRRRPQNVDLLGAATMLQAAGYEVREWVVGPGERPVPAAGQPVVWAVVPPPVVERRQPAPGDQELALLDAAASLLDGGEAVLLCVAPSMLPRTGQRDPWVGLVAELGLEADTGRVVFERLRDREGNTVNQRTIEIVDYQSGHPVAAAAHGLRTTFDLPVGLRAAPGAADRGVRSTTLAAVRAADNRWLEDDWMRNPATLDDPGESQRLREDLPLVLALERPDPVYGAGPRRSIVAGSAGWMLSYVADLAVEVGSARQVYLNPGNHELLLASVAWLAGADDLIAASPVSQQVARLEGITPSVKTIWRWIAVGGVPGVWLLAGVAVWAARRR